MQHRRKAWTALLLAMLMILSLAACKSQGTQATAPQYSAEGTAPTSVRTEAPTDEPATAEPETDAPTELPTEAPEHTEETTEEPTEASTEAPTEPPTEAPTEPEPLTAANYDELLEHYRIALEDPSSEITDPLVSVRLVTALRENRERYPNDFAELMAKYADLDGNGTPELVLVVDDYITDEDRAAALVYGMTDSGELVQLISEAECGPRDAVNFLADGRVMIWENSRHVSPSRLYIFQLDSGAGTMTLTESLTYRCGDDGRAVYETASGLKLGDADLIAMGETVAWDAFSMAETVGPAPTKGHDAAVIDAPELPESEEGWRPRLPHITLEGEVFEDFNAEVLEEYREYYETEELGLGYGWAVNDDILTVWIYPIYPGGWDPHTVYNFSVSEARLLSDDEVLERMYYSRSAFEEEVLPAMYGSCQRNGYFVLAYSEEEYESTAGYAFPTTERNAANAKPGVDRRGKLVIFAMVGSFAGGGEYNRIIPIG